jgi:hypothetical protein
MSATEPVGIFTPPVRCTNTARLAEVLAKQAREADKLLSELVGPGPAVAETMAVVRIKVCGMGLLASTILRAHSGTDTAAIAAWLGQVEQLRAVHALLVQPTKAAPATRRKTKRGVH